MSGLIETSDVGRRIVTPPAIVRHKRPTLHVTNWASRDLHGPGRQYTIMAQPWGSDYGEGRVKALSPWPEWADELREGFLSLRAYELQCREWFDGMHLYPGHLVACDVSNGYGDHERPVEDGDTLCCDCSQAMAAVGRCHRVWAAEALVAAGWRVLLDGKELSVEYTASPRPWTKKVSA